MNTETEPKVERWVEITETEYRAETYKLCNLTTVRQTIEIAQGGESEGRLKVDEDCVERTSRYYKRVNVKGPSGRGTSNG